MEIFARKKIIIAAIILAIIIFLIVRRTADDSKAKLAATIKGEAWFPFLQETALKAGINWKVIAAIVAVESAGDTQARGTSGEYGLMQIMSSTHRFVNDKWDENSLLSDFFGVPVGYLHKDKELLDPEYNLTVGIWYFQYLYNSNNKNYDKAIQLYNGSNELMTKIYLEKVKIFEQYF